MTSKERLLAAMRNEMPDRIPVAPDISTYIPVKYTGLPFWEVLWQNKVSLWQAYLDVAEYLENSKISKKLVIGYDLIEDNVDFLRKGTINFLLGQKPEEQGRNSIQALFNFIMTKKRIDKINNSPIDIIVKENVEFYLR